MTNLFLLMFGIKEYFSFMKIEHKANILYYGLLIGNLGSNEDTLGDYFRLTKAVYGSNIFSWIAAEVNELWNLTELIESS